ncbi:MAG: hypothetical protein J6Y05_07930 [Bacteroidales bacterium]|nr:hypothetical protein [Bacteroidales bacterium]
MRLSNLVPWLTCLLMVAVGLFYGLLYPYHLHYYEQMQMFQFSSQYFWETVLVPGGLADYLGRFLTQFFHITWAGALIMALLYGIVYLTSWLAVRNGLSGQNRLFWTILLLLPIRFLWINGCDENAMPALWIAFASSLLAVYVLKKIGNDTLRRGVALLAFIVLYAVVGPLSVVLMALMALYELRRDDGLRWVWALVFVGVAVILPQVAHRIVNWPLEKLYKGIHYFRFTQVQLPYIWVAAGLIVIIDLLSHLAERFLKGKEVVNSYVLGLGTLALMALLIFVGVKRHYRPNNEVMLMYDDMVLNERWDDILDAAKKRTPKHPACVQCINLAMAMKGRMGDLLFRVPQSDSGALLPEFSINFSRPLTAGQIYLNLGWTNTAQRFVYEAQESIPDTEKSARCYKLLAQTHLARGERALAKKYLKKLQKTLFYDDWANETMALANNPDPKTLAQHPFYGQLMRGAVKEDYFFSPDMMAMLGNYCTTTPHNHIATQYLLGLALVERDLETFVACFNLDQYLNGKERIPEYYQQALALEWTRKHQTLEGIPYNIDERVLDAMDQFVTDYNNQMPREQLERKYFFTYWFYYMTGEKPTKSQTYESAPQS